MREMIRSRLSARREGKESFQRLGGELEPDPGKRNEGKRDAPFLIISLKSVRRSTRRGTPPGLARTASWSFWLQLTEGLVPLMFGVE